MMEVCHVCLVATSSFIRKDIHVLYSHLYRKGTMMMVSPLMVLRVGSDTDYKVSQLYMYSVGS